MDSKKSKETSERYKALLAKFIKLSRDIGLDTPARNLEFAFESLSDWSVFRTLFETEKW